MATNPSAPIGLQRRVAPIMRPAPVAAGAGSGCELISLKNFRSDSISAQIEVVAGSMKPPNISFEIGDPGFAASIVTATRCADAVDARPTASNRNISQFALI